MTFASRLFAISKRRGSTPRIELLSRPGCHLCDVAERALVAEFGRDCVRVVDITQDQDLEDRYIFRIPVVLFDGDPVSEGIIDRREARRLRQHLRRRVRTRERTP